MNKQQLAAKIWASANKMRSKIEANEYKDYILGFIFYKFLSDNEVRHLKEKAYWSDEDIKNDLNDQDKETVRYCQDNLGYFISYDNLFSTWLSLGLDFSVSNVTDALNAFTTHISSEPNKRRVFKDIFKTLAEGITNLGGTPADRTKAITKLIRLIKDIPTDGSQDYDVLGFIYEYLIENFAANAGKKAGEFYTPHEVATLMAEIVADHLKDREKISIYDPTSGSGSLLINIGKAVAKYKKDKSQVTYYAQELKKNTYNLTRMNLVMRGIDADNIIVRCGDTLEDDWPFFNENEEGKIIEGSYSKQTVDAVVSNPPYSQRWNPKGKKEDPRFKDYGVAPRGKADYAFLLHDLCHIEDDGIVTIVLPHGVLFRPGDDYNIRKNLIDNNNIDAIIGLPADIFFGTPIATLVMVLKRHRPSTDVLMVDASRLSIKVGKKNKLTASDIRRIVDAVISRTETPKFSRLVSRKTIYENDYNLYIPRYIDSSDPLETWDAYSTMFGNIPNSEIDLLSNYWQTFPSLKRNLFQIKENSPCSYLSSEDVNRSIRENADVIAWKNAILEKLQSLPKYLDCQIIDNMLSLDIHQEESLLAKDLYSRLSEQPLIDKYDAYQLLDNQWVEIFADLEMLQTEGFQAAKLVDPNMVIKKSNKEDEDDKEIQKGWKGHILPFELVQKNLLKDSYDTLQQLKGNLDSTIASFTDLIQEMSEEDKDAYLNDDNTEFDMDKVNDGVTEALNSIESEEIDTLFEYISLLDRKAKKAEKQAFINANRAVDWASIEPAKDGTYSKKNVQQRINDIRFGYQFPEDSIECVLLQVVFKIEQVKILKRDIAALEKELHERTKTTIENLTDEQVHMLLRLKWIVPLHNHLTSIPDAIIGKMTEKVIALVEKYKTGLVEIEQKGAEASIELSRMLDDLTGSDYDMLSYNEFKHTLSNGLLELMKFASLEKLFPKQGQSVPQVRFKGFSGKWVEHKLSDLLTVYVEKNEQERYSKYDIFSVSNESGVVNQIKHQGKSLAGASLKNYKVTHKNSVIYTKSPLKNQPYGIIKANQDTSGIVSALYAVYSVSTNVNPVFVEAYFASDNRLNNYLRPIVNKGAKNTLLVSDEGALSGTVVFPEDIKEQEKIASFFSCLDRLISIRSRRH